MYCRKCGQQITDDAVFCYRCGTSTGGGSAPSTNPSFSSIPKENKTQGKVVYGASMNVHYGVCLRCGKQMSPSQSRCGYCGYERMPLQTAGTNVSSSIPRTASTYSASPTSVPQQNSSGPRRIRCVNCGSNLVITDTKREFAFCEYCGTKIVLDDVRVRVNQSFVDEARIKESDNKTKVEIQKLKIYEQELERYHKKLKIMIAILIVYSVLTLTLFAIGFNELAGVLLFFGVCILFPVAVSIEKPKDPNDRFRF